MLILKFLNKILKILRSGETPGQIAAGFILGMIPGLTPLWELHNLIVIFLIIVLNVNISMAILSFVMCSGIAYLLDPLFHGFGYWLLVDLEFLNGFWTYLYNFPVLALSHFNNTVVIGSLVGSLLLAYPVYLLVKKGVVLYRERIDAKVQNWKIVQVVKSSKLYSIYEKIESFRD